MDLYQIIKKPLVTEKALGLKAGLRLHRDLRLEHVVQVAPGSYRLGGFGVGRWMMAAAARADGTPIPGLPGVLR